MVITFSTTDDLDPSTLELVVADVVNPLLPYVSKVYIGRGELLDLAVKRYFHLIRPVRIVISFSSRVSRADIHFILKQPVNQVVDIRSPLVFTTPTYSYEANLPQAPGEKDPF